MHLKRVSFVSPPSVVPLKNVFFFFGENGVSAPGAAGGRAIETAAAAAKRLV